MALRLLAFALIASGLSAQTYTYTFRLTPQTNGTLLAEPFEGNAPTTLVQPLNTTWAETCLVGAGESYKLVTIAWTNGVPSYSDADLTPGGSRLTVQIVPLSPPAGFTVLGIVADQSPAPMAFYGDAATASAAVADWIASTWQPSQPCRTIRLRWIGVKAYPRLDMTPNEWHIAPAHWPVSATVTVGP